MNRFSINLATRPFRNNTLYWAGLAACVGLLSGFTWYNVNLYSGAGHDLERWNSSLSDHRTTIVTLDREVDNMRDRVEAIDLVAFSERSAFANEIILSRLFSWTSLFDRLEKVMPPKVRLRSIRPALGKDVVEITLDGMTPNPEALLDFEESLIDSEYFTFVYPNYESSRVKQGEINFSITFGYVPEGGHTGFVQDPVGLEDLADEEEAEGEPAESAAGEGSGEPEAGPPAVGGSGEEDPNAGEDPNDFSGDDDDEDPNEDEGEDGSAEGGMKP